ncbi:hypothetical protein JOC27_001042, partial [Sporolactobacillus spathodeae]|nr:hypothetical protein [Sporolactobacillus spathodeae]
AAGAARLLKQTGICGVSLGSLFPQASRASAPFLVKNRILSYFFNTNKEGISNQIETPSFELFFKMVWNCCNHHI